VSLQEWHPKDSILVELTDDECLLDGLVSDTSSKLNDAIEGNARLVCQGAILPFVGLQSIPDLSAEGVKELTA